RCGPCQAWGSVETGARPGPGPAAAPPERPAVPITEVDPGPVSHRPTGLTELDRVLGGGLTPGAVVLLAGEPGVGKSTLLLALAEAWSRRHGRVLYVSGEESAGQVKLRAGRTGADSPELFLAAETELAQVLGQIEQVGPSLVLVDSVQTISSLGVDGSAGGVAQVREVAAALIQVAKRRDLPVVLVGHVTKDGAIAGPRTLEHLVDVVVAVEGERRSGVRLVRAVKNRFGPADEVGCFQLAEGGVVEVADPSGVFTSRHDRPAPGSALTIAVEGRRPLLTELQALVAPTRATAPRRVSHGFDSGRLAMLLAVLQRRAGLRLHRDDVYVSTVGGARVNDPAADLAVACAVASAARDLPCPDDLVALAEVGLAGELRRTPDLGRRLNEAARLGLRRAVVPVGCLAELGGSARSAWPGLTVLESPDLLDALTQVGLGHRRQSSPGDERMSHHPAFSQARAAGPELVVLRGGDSSARSAP
ncbi:MAG: DNA repair protein RadA, partial [Propionibacteriaceae bacterium]|nr:DNA repair protein RadA [Propionibacteriaceae bacterium]